MAPTAAPLRNLLPGSPFKPSGHQIIAQYLAPRALRGDTTTVPGLVADDVDVFSAANPAALPFHPSSRRDHGEVWGYFYGDYPTDDVRPVPGGCWVRYGAEKGYVHGHGGAMEAVAFRRRFAFHVTWRDDEGEVVAVPTPWQMKEYRLNKGAAAFRAAAARVGPKANMDCVVRKIFAKPPPPPPPCSSEVEEFPASGYPVGEESGYSSDEEAHRLPLRGRTGEEARTVLCCVIGRLVRSIGNPGQQIQEVGSGNLQKSLDSCSHRILVQKFRLRISICSTTS